MYALVTGLSNYSWSEIGQIASEGNAQKFFSVGETKSAGSRTIRLVGFNCDPKARASGDTWPMSFIIENPEGNFLTPWGEGLFYDEMISYGTSSIYSSLPSDLQSVIKNTFKYYVNFVGNGGMWGNGKIVPVRVYDLFGSSVNGVDRNPEGSYGNQYPYFSSNSRRARSNPYYTGSSSWSSDGYQGCFVVSSDGSGIYEGEENHGRLGAMFCFCI